MLNPEIPQRSSKRDHGEGSQTTNRVALNVGNPTPSKEKITGSEFKLTCKLLQGLQTHHSLESLAFRWWYKLFLPQEAKGEAQNDGGTVTSLAVTWLATKWKDGRDYAHLQDVHIKSKSKSQRHLQWKTAASTVQTWIWRADLSVYTKLVFFSPSVWRWFVKAPRKANIFRLWSPTFYFPWTYYERERRGSNGLIIFSFILSCQGVGYMDCGIKNLH